MEQVDEWLTKDFLTQCLRSDEAYGTAVVTHFKASPAVPAGHNFGSCILWVLLDYQEHEGDSHTLSMSVIIKSPLTGNVLTDEYFSHEPRFYYEFLPQAYKHLNKSFAPKGFTSPVPLVVVMEDLLPQGYVMVERCKLLDFEHCKHYLSAAAALHATSFLAHREDPELIQLLSKEKLFTDDTKLAKLFKISTNLAMESLARHVSSYFGKEKISKIIKACSSSLWEMLVDVHKPGEGFNCISQSDPWVTNAMFRYDESGGVIDVKLLDFQCLRFGSPLNQVVYFLWSSASHDVRRHRLQELYHFYIETLNNYLSEMGCDERVSFDQLMKTVQELSPLALWLVCYLLPNLLNPSPPNLKEIFAKSVQDKGLTMNPFDEFYNEDFCQNHLPKLITDLELIGVFEYLEKRLS